MIHVGQKQDGGSTSLTVDVGASANCFLLRNKRKHNPIMKHRESVSRRFFVQVKVGIEEYIAKARRRENGDRPWLTADRSKINCHDKKFSFGQQISYSTVVHFPLKRNICQRFSLI